MICLTLFGQLPKKRNCSGLRPGSGGSSSEKVRMQDCSSVRTMWIPGHVACAYKTLLRAVCLAIHLPCLLQKKAEHIQSPQSWSSIACSHAAFGISLQASTKVQYAFHRRLGAQRGCQVLDSNVQPTLPYTSQGCDTNEFLATLRRWRLTWT